LDNNVLSYGLENVEFINCDATNKVCLDTSIENRKFDKILLDVPCSGWGLFRSKPETKIYQKQEEINGIIKVQEEILNNSLNFLKEDGIIIYSTCTLNKEENEEQVKRFCEKHDFKIMKDEELEKVIGKSELGYTLLPAQYNTTGFYICILKRG
jgi:16S rRNA (cytosine967-C5)-methyltransferase